MVRIGGLASGMDIDQIVSDLMKAERMPLDKIKQKSKQQNGSVTSIAK